jgi:hypothetical protein
VVSGVSKIDGVVTWAPRGVIDLNKFTVPEVVATCMFQVKPVGYADVVFIFVDPSLYMIQLKSMHIQAVSETGGYWFVFFLTQASTAPGISIVLDVAKFTLVFQIATTILTCRCFQVYGP